MKPQGATATYRPWSPAEDDAIRARYVAEGVSKLPREFGRTDSAVHHRARRLGVIRNRRWTAAHDAELRVLRGEHPIARVAKLLGRTPATTYWRAQKIGLPLGCAQGLEYLTDAAIRTGYGTGQLRRILKWAGSSLRVSMARPTGAKRHFHTVDPFDVDEAVARWHETETLNAAAIRHGLCPETLARRLLASGLEVPPKPTGKRHWRVPSEIVDRVAA